VFRCGGRSDQAPGHLPVTRLLARSGFLRFRRRITQRHATAQRARALAVKCVTRPLLKIQNPLSNVAFVVELVASCGRSRTTVHKCKPPAPVCPIPIAWLGVVEPAVPTGLVSTTPKEVAGAALTVAHTLTAMACVARARQVGASAIPAFDLAPNIARFLAVAGSQSEAVALRLALTGMSVALTSTQVGIPCDRAVWGKRKRDRPAKPSKSTFMTASLVPSLLRLDQNHQRWRAVFWRADPANQMIF
jgi:hypothetical protein